MKWDSAYGTWSLVDTEKFSIRGTTFRNSGYLKLTVDLFEYTWELYFGRHIGTRFWWGDNLKEFEWKPKKCKCYGCRIHQPLSRNAREAILKAMRDGTIPVRKLPPRNDT